MSDEDRDVDIESDDDEDDYDRNPGQFSSQAEKRAHHNALERKRRDHIKDSFSSLRDSIPTLHGEKASRAQILKKAADYIHQMRKKNTVHQHDIDDLREQNELLETQVKALEKAKATGNLNGLPVLDTASFISCNSKGNTVSAFDGGSDSESSDSELPPQTRRKKMKTNII